VSIFNYASKFRSIIQQLCTPPPLPHPPPMLPAIDQIFLAGQIKIEIITPW
jgi:hypothetical protein